MTCISNFSGPDSAVKDLVACKQRREYGSESVEYSGYMNEAFNTMARRDQFNLASGRPGGEVNSNRTRCKVVEQIILSKVLLNLAGCCNILFKRNFTVESIEVECNRDNLF